MSPVPGPCRNVEITEGPEVGVLAEATEPEALSDQIDRAMKEPKGRRQL